MVALRANTHPTRAELLGRRRALEQRLIDGWKRIDAAVADGRDVADWERHWMLLLGEYQRVCADLVSVKRALQGPRAAPPTAGSALTFTAPPLRGASRH